MTNTEPAVTPEEKSLLTALQRMVGPLPPLEFDAGLYHEAVLHGQRIHTRALSKLHDGFSSRKAQFPNARRFTEICFISQPSGKDPQQAIISTIRSRYMSRVTSGINKAGVALFPLSTGCTIVVILLAFLRPEIPGEEVETFLSKLAEDPLPLQSYDSLLDYINQYRALIRFPPLVPTRVDPPANATLIRRKTQASDSFEFFYKWLADPVLFELLNELWASFSISCEREGQMQVFRSSFVVSGLATSVTIRVRPADPLSPHANSRDYSPITSKFSLKLGKVAMDHDDTPSPRISRHPWDSTQKSSAQKSSNQNSQGILQTLTNGVPAVFSNASVDTTLLSNSGTPITPSQGNSVSFGQSAALGMPTLQIPNYDILTTPKYRQSPRSPRSPRGNGSSDELDDLKKQISSLETKNNELNKENQNLKQELTAEQAAEQRESQLEHLKAENDRLKREIQLQKQISERLEKEKKDLQKHEREMQSDANAAVSKRIQHLEEENKKLQDVNQENLKKLTLADQQNGKIPQLENEINQLKQQLKEKEQNIDDNQKNATEAEQKLRDLEKTIHELKQQLNEKDQQLNDKDQQLNEKNQELNHKEQNINDNQKDVTETKQKLNDLDKIINELKQQLNEKDQQLSQKDQQLNEKDQQLSQKDQQLNEKENQLNEKSQQLSEKDHQLNEKDGQLSEKDHQLNDQEQKLDEKEKIICDLQQKLNEKESTNSNQEHNLNDRDQRLSDQQQKLNQQDKIIEEQKQQLSENERIINEQQQKLNEKDRQLKDLENQANNQLQSEKDQKQKQDNEKDKAINDQKEQIIEKEKIIKEKDDQIHQFEIEKTKLEEKSYEDDKKIKFLMGILQDGQTIAYNLMQVDNPDFAGKLTPPIEELQDALSTFRGMV